MGTPPPGGRGRTCAALAARHALPGGQRGRAMPALASWLPLLLVLGAAGAAARPAPSPPPWDDAARSAFAVRLEAAVLARLLLLPEADEPLRAAAAACADAVGPTQPLAFREAEPRLIGLPTGRVLVSTGLLAAVETDAEFVSLLAHEAAHVQRGDMLDRLTKAYGARRLARIASGGHADVLAGMAANVAASGLLTRHGSLNETLAEDAARRAGCGGGLAAVLRRATLQWRPRRQQRLSHDVGPPVAGAFAGAHDASVHLVTALRESLGPLP